MPNWVKHNISFLGKQEQIDNLFEAIKSDERIIDFEKIIPMPDTLRITSGSSTDLGIDIIKYKETGEDKSLKERLTYQWVSKAGIKTIDELINYCIEKGTADINEGQLALDNIKLYGHKDWHSWSIDNWGTKWNATRSSRNNNTLSFETAWSIPEPILVELSEIFPEIIMHVEYADEDIGTNCGEFDLENGLVNDYKPFDGIKACEIWGYDPADYFPEIRRDRRIDEVFLRDDNNN